MAYYQEDNEDELDPNNPQSGIVQTGPQSGTISPGPATASAGPTPTNKPDNPGNFVGIKQYLDANKPQAQKLGDQASGIINQSADTARQGLGALGQEANEKIKPVASLTGDISNKIQNNAETLTSDERSNVKNTANAQYKGPRAVTDLNAYQAAADATNKANQNIMNSGTEQGRMGLISQINNKPRTQGMNVFDNVLLQAGGGREKLAQASTANQDLKTGLTDLSGNIQNQIGRADDPSTPDINEATGAIGQTNTAQADAYKKIQDALSGWKSGFNPKVDQARNALTQSQNALTQDFGDGQYELNENTLGAIGLSGDERLFGTNLSDYLNQISPNDINASNIASTEDYARYGALADLAGEQNLLLDQANVGQAGTAKTSAYDKDKFLSDRLAAENAFNTLAGDTILSGSGQAGSTQNNNSEASAALQIMKYLTGGISEAGVNQRFSQFPGLQSAEEARAEAARLAKKDLEKKIKTWLEDNRYNTQVKKKV